MSEVHLDNSPIREAVIDFRFNFTSPVDLAGLDSSCAALGSEYPTKEVIDLNSLFFDMSADNKPKFEHTKGIVGYRLISDKKDAIIQFRVDGFTFSKMRPYTSWEDVTERVKRAYGVYIGAVKADKITRIATRYINFIPLGASENLNIKKYFNFFPCLPSDLGSAIDNFLMRVSFKDEISGINTVVNQGLAIEHNAATAETVRSIVFDIDSFIDKADVQINNPWEYLNQVKEFTNKAFFEGVTEYTESKFK